MPRSFLKHLVSTAWIFLSSSAVNVQDSHAYRNIDMTRERISLILDLVGMFLSFQMVWSFDIAADVCAILDIISGLDPWSVTIAPRYLKLVTDFSFSPLTLMSVLMTFVICH